MFIVIRRVKTAFYRKYNINSCKSLLILRSDLKNH